MQPVTVIIDDPCQPTGEDRTEFLRVFERCVLGETYWPGFVFAAYWRKITAYPTPADPLNGVCTSPTRTTVRCGRWPSGFR